MKWENIGIWQYYGIDIVEGKLRVMYPLLFKEGPKSNNWNIGITRMDTTVHNVIGDIIDTIHIV